MAFPSAALADQIVGWILLAILLVTLVVQAVAFVHCATRRADAFPVVSRFPKSIWVLMTGGALVFTFLTSGATFAGGGGGMFGVLTSLIAIIAMVIALVYLLDMRPALKDVTEGRGHW